jgi:hypothetical protein
VLALFSLFLLRTPLRLSEWAAVVLVSAGVIMLGVSEPGSTATAESLASTQSLTRIAIGIAGVAIFCIATFFVGRVAQRRSRFMNWRLVVFAALSGLLSSIGDLCIKVLLSVLGDPASSTPWLIAASAAGLIAFYLAGFYMLSRAYQAGSMVAGVIISDFFARIGAIFLGAVALVDAIFSPGPQGALRMIGLAIVLGGSLLLGRFSSTEPTTRSPT